LCAVLEADSERRVRRQVPPPIPDGNGGNGGGDAHKELLEKCKFSTNIIEYLVGPYLAGPNYWPALIWPRPKLAFGQFLAKAKIGIWPIRTEIWLRFIKN